MEKLPIYERINRWRLVPRLLVLGYAVLFWYIANWFMDLTDPTATQAAFVSTVSGIAGAIFGLYVNSGSNNKDEQ